MRHSLRHFPSSTFRLPLSYASAVGGRESQDSSPGTILPVSCYTVCVMKWRVVLEQDIDTGDWAAWCPELPGCTSAGDTEDEAMTNIREAIELYLEPDAIPMP